MYRYENLYKIAGRVNLGSAQFWNVRFFDIDIRLNAVEAVFSKVDDAVNVVTAAGIDRINNTIQPAIDNLSAEVTALSVDVVSLQAQVNTTSGSFTTQMNSILAAANDSLAALSTLGTIDGGTFG